MACGTRVGNLSLGSTHLGKEAIFPQTGLVYGHDVVEIADQSLWTHWRNAWLRGEGSFGWDATKGPIS